MAKGKAKSSAPAVRCEHKKHGPKKRMFHCWTSTIRLALAKAGLLKKEHNAEAMKQSENARGIR